MDPCKATDHFHPDRVFENGIHLVDLVEKKVVKVVVLLEEIKVEVEVEAVRVGIVVVVRELNSLYDIVFHQI